MASDRLAAGIYLSSTVKYLPWSTFTLASHSVSSGNDFSSIILFGKEFVNFGLCGGYVDVRFGRDGEHAVLINMSCGLVSKHYFEEFLKLFIQHNRRKRLLDFFLEVAELFDFWVHIKANLLLVLGLVKSKAFMA